MIYFVYLYSKTDCAEHRCFVSHIIKSVYPKILYVDFIDRIINNPLYRLWFMIGYFLHFLKIEYDTHKSLFHILNLILTL